jgi:hypothetical protein
VAPSSQEQKPQRSSDRKSNAYPQRHIVESCAEDSSRQNPGSHPTDWNRPDQSNIKTAAKKDEACEQNARHADELSNMAKIVRNRQKADNSGEYENRTR